MPEPAAETADVKDIIAQIRQFRKGRKLGKDVTLRELIGAGRRLDGQAEGMVIDELDCRLGP